MRNDALFTIVFCFLGLSLFSQTYSIDEISFFNNPGCGQTTTNYIINFRFSANSSNGNITGYTVIDTGTATFDGVQQCDYDNTRDEYLNTSEAICAIFTESNSHCCDDETVNFRIVPNLTITTPNTQPPNSTFTLNATAGFNSLIYNWQYFDPFTGIWTDLRAAFLGQSSFTFTLPELFQGTGRDYRDYLNLFLDFRIGLCNGWVSDETIQLQFVEPSPEWQNTTKTNATCNGATDGSVTLTFDSNIATDSDMRYYIYQRPEGVSTPQAAFQGTTDDPNPAQAFAEVRLGSLADNNNGTFSGSSTLGDIVTGDGSLGVGEYYILYQEVNYNSSPVEVKSGELIPNFFTIAEPTPITLNTSSPNFFNQANCGNPAIFQLNGTATGGNNLNASGTFGYEYSLNAGLNWLPVTGTNNVLEIPATTNTQSVQVRGVYNLNNVVCVGQNYTYPISAIVNPIVITNPTKVNTSTASAVDGSVRIEFSGGTPNNTYELNSSTTIPNPNPLITSLPSGNIVVTYNDLPADTYSITVTDANGCPQTSPDLIVGTETVPILGTPAITPISCTGTAGSISVPISNFDTEYKYEWTINGVASPITIGTTNPIILNNISIGGMFELRVSARRVTDTDFPNPTNHALQSFTLNPPTPVTTGTPTANNVSCEGLSDGSIVLTPSGGTSYQYTLELFPTESDWLPLTNNTILGLARGIYRVILRNENGCRSTTTAAILIDEPNAITISEVTIDRSNVTVNGATDGALSIAVTGGTGAYAYAWTRNGTAFTPTLGATPNNLINLTAGNYAVEITDAKGCTSNFGPIPISEPGPLGITTLNPTNVLCNGATTGSITAIVNGMAPFTFVWSRAGDPSFTAPNQATITGLTAGTYTLSLTDTSGETAVTSSVIITEPIDFLTATSTPTATSCASLNDGAITIVASGGTAPYRYSLNGSATQNSTNFNALAPGVYTVTVFDANNCEFVLNTINVFSATAIAISTDLVLNVSESGESDGAISTSISGGTLPHTFTWTGPNGFTANTKDITNLAEGIHILTVTDANNCSASQAFNITEPSELTVTASQSLFLDCTDDDYAEIVATVTGGIPNYSYQWFQIENGSTNQINETSTILANLSVGSYFVVVTDANNVSRTSNTISVTEPDILNAAVLNKVDVLCSGESTGSIQIAVSGGTSPYTFYWNGDLSTQNLNNIAAGDYFLEVIDANGCSDDLVVTVASPTDPLRIQDATVINASDYQVTDGSLSIAVAGGVPDYSFEWTRSSDNTVISNQSSISNLAAGFYEVLITDANTCAIRQTYEITQPDTIEETITNPTCAGLADGSISLLVNRGNGNFTYSWNTGATTNTITNLTAGTYSVVITGFDNPETRTYTIEEPLPILVDLGGDRVLCKGQSLALDATVANSNAIYRWTSDTGFTSSNPIVTLSEKGNYTISVSSNGNCTQTSSIFVDVSDQEISAEFAASSQVYAGETLVLVDISFPIPDSMEWIIPDSAQILNQNKDEAEIVFATPGEYEVGIITQRGSCTEMQIKKIMVLAKDPTVTEEDTQGGKKLVENFIIYPNPTSGEFKAQVDLTDRGNISIKVFSFTNNMLIASEKARGESSYTIPFNIANMPAGVYAVVLETPYGSTLRKIIVR